MEYKFHHRLSDKDFVLDINNKHVEGGMKHKGEWFYEQKMLDWICKHYDKGGVYVDVGAWVGTHSIYFAEVMEADVVYAFEPVEEHIKNFKKNVELNNVNNIKLFEFGLSDENRQLRYTKNRQAINPCAVYLEEKGKHSCEVKTLDSLNLKNIKILKADIEHMELKMLKGGEKTIRRDMPHLFLELEDEEYRDEVTKFLDGWGYKREEKFNATPTYRFIPK